MQRILSGAAALSLLLLMWSAEAQATHCVYQGRQGYITFYFCPSHSAPSESAPQRPEFSSSLLLPRPTPRHPTGNALLADLARMTAERYGVNPKLVAAVIEVESGWNPRAVSPKGAKGLMQLMPKTAARFGVRDIFDPHENVDAGTRYLRLLLDLFGGNVRLALAAYNAGEEAVTKYGGIPPYAETQAYVPKVLSLLR